MPPNSTRVDKRNVLCQLSWSAGDVGSVYGYLWMDARSKWSAYCNTCLVRIDWMNMKKAILILEVVLIISLLSSCQWIGNMRKELINEFEEPDKIAQQAISAIENKDEDALTSLFSKRALVEADDLEEGVDYTFDFYQGECLEIEKGYCIIRDRYGTDRRQWAHARYKVTTTEGAYWLYFEYSFINAPDPEAEGLYYFSLNDYETVEKIDEDARAAGDFRTTHIPFHAGIYHPDWNGKYSAEHDPNTWWLD